MIRDSVFLKRCLLAISKPRPCRGTVRLFWVNSGFPSENCPQCDCIILGHPIGNFSCVILHFFRVFLSFFELLLVYFLFSWKGKTCSRKNSEFICVVALYYCEGIPFRILWKRKLCWSKKTPLCQDPARSPMACKGRAEAPQESSRVNLRFSWVMTLEYTCFGGPSCLASKNDTWFGVSKALLARHFQAKAVPGHRETLLGKLGFPIGKLPPMWLHNIRASYW